MKDVCGTGLRPYYGLWIRKDKECFGKRKDTMQTSDGHAAWIGNHTAQHLELPILLAFGGESGPPGQGQDRLTSVPWQGGTGAAWAVDGPGPALQEKPLCL